MGKMYQTIANEDSQIVGQREFDNSTNETISIKMFGNVFTNYESFMQSKYAQDELWNPKKIKTFIQ